MKQTTKDWLAVAEDDLLAAKTLSRDERLTSLVSFHCQQCLEKCFKAIIEEQNKPALKSHDLLRLRLHETRNIPYFCLAVLQSCGTLTQ